MDYVALISYAKGKGLNVVPELKLLTHQEKFFGLTTPYWRDVQSEYV
jgi:hypothetical protein